MAPRIFITGVSGYIGGHLVDRLSQSHPEYHVVGLVRDKAQAEQVTTKFPNIETVFGDLDSHEVLVKEASKADVILRKSLCHFTSFNCWSLRDQSLHHPTTFLRSNLSSKAQANGKVAQAISFTLAAQYVQPPFSRSSEIC
jgi:nucleoside-diphosphate-sugar epimerase